MASGFGGSSGGTAMVRMVLDTGGYQSALNSAHSQTVAKTSQMGQSYQKLKGLATQALGAIGAVELLRRSVAAYDQQTKAVARLNIAFQNSPALVGASTQAFIAQATALSRLTGTQDEQIIGAQAALAVFGLTEDQLKRITPLVLDYAAFTGSDVTSSAEAMGRAVLGNARALKTIGIDFTRTGDRAKDFETIMTLVGAKVGGTAEAIATPLDKMKVAADEAFEAIGEFLAPALEGLTAVMGAIPAPILGAAVALGVLKLAFKSMSPEMMLWITLAAEVFASIGAITKVLQGQGNVTTAVGQKMAESFALIDGQLVAVTKSADGSVSSVNAAGQEFEELAHDFQDAAAAARDLRSAQLALEGGMLGLVSSADSASEAERNLTEARKNLTALTRAGKKGTAEYAEAQRAVHDAALNSVQSQLSLTGAIQDYQNKLASGEVSRSQAIKDLRRMGHDAGLTAGEVDALIGRVLGLGGSIRGLPGSKHIVISADTAAAYAQIASVVNAVAAIPAYKTVHIYADVAGGAALGDGGIVYGASGFITKGPTMFRPGMVAGEAGYATQFGRGAEAVIPLTDQTLDRLAAAINGRGGGATIQVYGASPEQTAELVLSKLNRQARF